MNNQDLSALCVRLPRDLHLQLKYISTLRNIPMRSATIEALSTWVNKEVSETKLKG